MSVRNTEGFWIIFVFIYGSKISKPEVLPYGVKANWEPL